MESTTNVSSDWPPEIIDLFVQENNDRQTLHSCMKVSRSFYQAARRRVFSSLSLRFYGNYKITETCMKPLREIFEGNSAALQDVKNVTVDISCDWPAEDQKFNPGRDADAQRVAYLTEEVESKPGEHPEFTRLLFLLAGGSQVHTFTLESETQWADVYVGVDFRELHDNVLLALIALRCIPSLRTLRLRSINNPPEPLVIGNPDCDQLAEVDIRGGDFPAITFGPLSAPEGPEVHPGFAASNFTTSPLSKVVILRLDRTYPFYQFLQKASKQLPSSFSFQNLKELYCCTPRPPDTFYANPAERETMHRMFSHGLPALEFLSIALTHDYDFPGRLSLDLIPNLRRLQFSINIWQYGNHGGPKGAGFLTSLSQFLHTKRSPNLIEAVTLNVLSMANCEIEYLSPLLDCRANWDLLDATLASPGYSSLRRLTLNMTFSFWGSPDLNDEKTKGIFHQVEISSKGLLPRLTERREVESSINVVCKRALD